MEDNCNKGEFKRESFKMSRELALNAVSLKSQGRFAHTEYSLDYHSGLVGRFKPRSLSDVFGLDFIWSVNDCVDWLKAGRATDMGHADYAENGSDRREAQDCPFHDVEEVYEFDPCREYGLPSHRELVKFYQDVHRRNLAAHPDRLVTGGYYKSVVSGAIQAFGWDMLLLAAADPERFAEVLGRFGSYTLNFNAAWADTDIEVFIQHDDMVWSSGPFMNPDLYRSVVFPLYKKLWEPLKRKGKKVLFCCDGTFDMFMDEIAAAGADGFIFEPSNDFESVVERFGSTHCIVGSKVDCRAMTFGTWEEVKRQMDETAEIAKRCKGFIWAVGNHIPANVSDEMCLLYNDHLKKLRGA